MAKKKTKTNSSRTTKSNSFRKTKSNSFRKIWNDLNRHINKSRKLRGGFIRAGSTQHFYAPCNTNEVILDKNNQTFQQKMVSVNMKQMAKQPNIYSVNGRDINIAADTNRSRYH